jgi:acyl-homoserine-lactone acylase
MFGKKMYIQRQVLILSLLLTLFILLTCSKTNQTTIYRDTWGVPHIYANSEFDMAFAFGYAQAEDRLEQLLKFYRYAEGTMAEAFGKDYVELDYNQRVWKHKEISQEKFSTLSKDVQEIVKYFVAGIKQYMKENPEKVPEWAPEVQNWHPVAWSRAFIWDWPLGQAMSDLRRGLRKIEEPHHSNQWVVSAERTASGVPIALIDPHLSFETTGHWCEARLHASDMQVCGMCVVGTPFVGLGHNRYISWAATTGGPDCADVYELETNPNNSLQYKYDGEWRDITTEEIIIRVKKDGGFSEVKKTVERSHHGPIVERRDNKAFAIKCAYENEIGLAEQFLKINKAKNLKDFKNALSMCQMMPQNMMFACVNGDIYYARTGRVPIRPDGYNWDYPVPGNTKDSEWQGIHPHDELLQITNPECGFMQNCNISPGTMMPNSPFTEDKYPEYIYNDSQNRSNPRGRSTIRLLSAEENLTLKRAKQIALDTSVDGFEIWQAALKNVSELNGQSKRDLKDAVELILDWNGRLDADNLSAPLFRFWRQECSKMDIGVSVKENGKINKISKQNQKKMLLALQRAQSYLTAKFGSFQVPWGTTVRLKRGDKTWPVSGGSLGNGISVLRAAGGRFSEATGVTTVNRGQSCCMVVELSSPIQSSSILPWGQSDDPDSPHFTDQAEKLFSKSKFKSTFFQKEDLMKNIEFEKNIFVPEIQIN